MPLSTAAQTVKKAMVFIAPSHLGQSPGNSAKLLLISLD